SSQTTTTPSQHTRTNKQSVTISAGATFQAYPQYLSNANPLSSRPTPPKHKKTTGKTGHNL
ncbi:hypothetical protein, partial [Arthrobacter sp. HY1533]